METIALSGKLNEMKMIYIIRCDVFPLFYNIHVLAKGNIVTRTIKHEMVLITRQIYLENYQHKAFHNIS